MALPMALVHRVDLACEMQRVSDLVGPEFAAQLDGKAFAPLGGDEIGEAVREILARELRSPENEAVLLFQIELANGFRVFKASECCGF